MRRLVPLDLGNWVIVGFLVCAGVGCGGGSPGTSLAPEEDQARELVAACLDSWRDGQADGLASRRPPIRFHDPDLAARTSIVEYSIGPSARSFGHVVELPVQLKLKDRRGRIRTVDAAYQVSVEPELTVLRVEPGD